MQQWFTLLNIHKNFLLQYSINYSKLIKANILVLRKEVQRSFFEWNVACKNI